jgi:hypothetical protein
MATNRPPSLSAPDVALRGEERDAVAGPDKCEGEVEVLAMGHDMRIVAGQRTEATRVRFAGATGSWSDPAFVAELCEGDVGPRRW